ncbi:MAG: cell division protein FtsQ/DivIB [Candidatus Omnitrophota bacterium]
MKKRKIKVPVKPAASAAAVVLILFISFNLLATAARNSRLFIVRDVIVRQDIASGEKIDLSFLAGRNIMDINLQEQERNITKLYPGYNQIKLVRIFPDRLFAYFIKRKPVAAVKLNRYFCVDENAVLFDMPAAGSAASIELPVIYGLQGKIPAPQPGRKYNVRELLLAVNLTKVVKNNRQLRGLKIIRIDVTNPANASLSVSLPAMAQAKVPAGMEIKVGQDYLADKMNILASLLIQGRSDWDNIKYIDLRFKEPVIKFKDKAKK